MMLMHPRFNFNFISILILILEVFYKVSIDDFIKQSRHIGLEYQ